MIALRNFAMPFFLEVPLNLMREEKAAKIGHILKPCLYNI